LNHPALLRTVSKRHLLLSGRPLPSNSSAQTSFQFAGTPPVGKAGVPLGVLLPVLFAGVLLAALLFVLPPDPPPQALIVARLNRENKDSKAILTEIFITVDPE
jgi:hypothetical protein